MDLESRALSAPRVDVRNHKTPPAKFVETNPDDSSVQSHELHRGKRSRPSAYHSETTKTRKRKRIEDKNTVTIYNVSPRTDRATFENFVQKMLLKMHGRKIRMLKCECISYEPARQIFIVTFATSELVDLAMSLNGVQFMKQTLYVSIYNPDWAHDKTRKLRLCFNHLCGTCSYGERCYHAHGVLDLKLYNKTILSENRTVYIKGFPIRYPHLLNTIKKRYEEQDIHPFFTAFHVRREIGDALVEFADVRHAKKAHDVLNGIWIANCQFQVRPWKSGGQTSFVRYFEDEAKTGGTGGNNGEHTSGPKAAPKSLIRTEDTRKQEANVESACVTPTKKAQSVPASSRNMDERETQSAALWEDDKRELQRLRQKVSELQQENSECKRLENEARNDLRNYRDRLETERSYVKEIEDKVDGLRRENDKLLHERSHGKEMEEKVDNLRRENDLLLRENGDLRKRHNDSARSFGSSFRDMGKNSYWEELCESRNRVGKLQWQLDKTIRDNAALVKDSNHLKSTIEYLQSNNNRLKRESEQARDQDRNHLKTENEQIDLQRQLDEALSKIEELNGIIATTQLELKGLRSEKDSMNAKISNLQGENESLQEEMEQMKMNHAMELGFSGADEA